MLRQGQDTRIITVGDVFFPGTEHPDIYTT